VTRTEDEAGRETEKVVIRDRRKIDPNGTATGESVSDAKETKAKESGGGAHRAAESEEAADVVTDPGTPGLGAELEALRTELDERTRDLQRVTAEYANYRKRVDRDRTMIRDLAVASVIESLLPVLDDIHLARQHGDLEAGPLASIADKLESTLAKYGVQRFGEPGAAFDPAVHDALMHVDEELAEGTEVTTVVGVLQPGYRIGDRVVRPARVSVADPT